MIEKSLFQRLDSFPKLLTKENIKLCELGDLLQDIQGAKEDGYLAGLSYFKGNRSNSGQTPICAPREVGVSWL